jgi:hypothetical protein
LMSGIPDPQDRGSYMAVSASIQQISGGIAAAISGFVVVQTQGGVLEHFEQVGYIVIGTTAITVAMMYGVHRHMVSGPVRAVGV